MPVRSFRCLSRLLGGLLMLAIGARGADLSPAALRAERERLVEEARQALEGDDAPAALDAIRAILKLLPNHPSYLQALAAIGARNDDREAVLSGLRHMALSGIAWPPDESLGDIIEDRDVKRALVLASANRVPKGDAEAWATLPDASFLIEGIAPAEEADTFYAGDLAQPVIYRASAEGEIALWKRVAEDRRLGIFGLQRHPEKDRLLACVARPRPGDSAGMAFVAVLSLPDGAMVERREVPATLGASLLGDAVFGPGETVFATDSHGGRLLVSREPGVPFTVLGEADWPSPQGIVWDARRERLFVADYSLGIFACDPETGAAERLPAPPTSCLVGIDGLYAYRGSLLAVQNATLPQRVLWLSLNTPGDRIGTTLPLLSGDPRLHDPTLGFVRDDHFYFVARSPWPYLVEDRFERPADDRTLVLQISLLSSHE